MNQASDRTVLGVASLKRALPVIGIVLVALFVAMRPETTRGLGVGARTVFWTVHIAIGMGGVFAASLLVRQRPLSVLPPIVAVLITAVAGAALVAPFYVMVEPLIPVPAAEPDDWLDQLAAAGWWQSVVAEFIEVLPAFTAAWIAVNLPLVLSRPEMFDPPPPDDPGPGSGEEGARARLARQRIVDAIPDALGSDVVSVSSDLHYLHVVTVLGKAMILGNLNDIELGFAGQGLRVHRSHWVADRHVLRFQVSGNVAQCVMSTDHRIPVSRRKRAEARQRYGTGGVRLHPVDARRESA